jgi:hypothetical protein
MSAENVFCSQHSLALREPLFATAPRIEAWILLEYPYPFSAKTFEESSLSEDLKAHLSAALDSIPHSRLLMIKQKINLNHSGFDLILVKSSAQDQRITRYRMDTYDDLFSIDIESSLTSSATIHPGEETSPLFLVCTNGKRDRCCARYGLPVFIELQKFGSGDVWQSSHVGGHRFAANVINLPYGIYYGRLTAPEVQSFVELAKEGEIVLPYYRGRTCYTEEQQAADYFLRKHSGNTLIEDLQLVDTTEIETNRWLIRFKSLSGENYRLKIRREISNFNIIESCNSPQKAKPQDIYYLDGIS